MNRYVKELGKTQWFSEEELKLRQLKQIQTILHYAYEHVPYYRVRFKHENIHPLEIKTYRDFRKIPFLTREDVNADLESMLSNEYKGKVKLDLTGGSTGTPLRFYSEKGATLCGGAVQIRGRDWYGVRQGQKIAWVWGALRDMKQGNWPQRLKRLVKRHRYLNAFSMTKTQMESFADNLVKWKPDMIRAYPSALEIFARFLKNQNVQGISPKLIETSAEELTDYQRGMFEEVFKCPIAECYSSRELYEMAYACPSGGIHVCETVYLELVRDDVVVESGEEGEIVITSLTRFGMPFIRYKIGDRAVYHKAPCICGRGLPVLQNIIGRVTDVIVTHDGKIVDGKYFAYVFHDKKEILRYQIRQKSTTSLEVYLVCGEIRGTEWIQGMKTKLENHLGRNMKISINFVDELELTPAGKLHHIISELDREII